MSNIEKLIAAHETAAPAMGLLSLLIESKRGLTVGRLEDIKAALRGAVAILDTVEKDASNGS